MIGMNGVYGMRGMNQMNEMNEMKENNEMAGSHRINGMGESHPVR